MIQNTGGTGSHRQPLQRGRHACHALFPADVSAVLFEVREKDGSPGSFLTPAFLCGTIAVTVTAVTSH